MDLQPGDIGAVKGSGLVPWLNRYLASPKTDRFHHFIIWGKMDQDYLILESIGSKGLSIGKLSFYQDQDVIFYRVNCDQDRREKAPWGLIEYGRSKYDHWLYLRIMIWAVGSWINMLLKGEFRKLKAEDFPYKEDRAFICTEAVEKAFLSVDFQIVDAGVVPVPSAFKKAEIEGRIYKIQP